MFSRIAGTNFRTRWPANAVERPAINWRPVRQASAGPGLTRHVGSNVTVLRQAAPVVEKSLGQLHEMDILAENLPSPSTTEVFLLNQGVVLNLRYIEKLSSLARAENKELRVPVFEPSPLTEFFCLGRISGK